MIEKIKAYYKNSPKRIGWTWFLVHVFFLLVAIVVGNVFSDTLSFSLFAIGIFPSLIIRFLAEIFDDLAAIPGLPIFVSAAYYCLFFIMCFFAKDTNRRKFSWTLLVFILWFLSSLTVGLQILFSWFSNS